MSGVSTRLCASALKINRKIIGKWLRRSSTARTRRTIGKMDGYIDRINLRWADEQQSTKWKTRRKMLGRRPDRNFCLCFPMSQIFDGFPPPKLAKQLLLLWRFTACDRRLFRIIWVDNWRWRDKRTKCRIIDIRRQCHCIGHSLDNEFRIEWIWMGMRWMRPVYLFSNFRCEYE